MSYFTDYPKKKIQEKGNPYYCCVYCEKSDPEINGMIKRHSKDCLYRKQKEALGFKDD